ncbi:MAG: hypothetical protein AUI12_19065 [Acidobacteria bacterium 13_2_20CM_2_57_6]|nr:MAG: hypothetical protein AUH16_04715 [Acidobacteria bacterium 13_2_20CM_57_7]OLB82452.1 MAG: hypothetical protein AUI12_19065 [Acidobacteria bacterium 13_2_20CM_2_57_6]
MFVAANGRFPETSERDVAKSRDTISAGCLFNLNGMPEQRNQMRQSTAFLLKRQLWYSLTLSPEFWG